MARLFGVGKSLRFVLDVADREVPLPVPGTPPPDPGSGRLLCTCAVEFFDRRDREYWPMIRLPVVWLGGGDGEAMLRELSRLVRGEGPGFAFRSSASPDLALQVGKQPEIAGYTVEVGLDLGNFLAESAGAQAEPGRDLALFRFATDQAALVSFAGELREDLRRVVEPR